MSACEPCWGEAFAKSRMFGGGQVEWYQRLLRENIHYTPTPPTTDAQEACSNCGHDHAEPFRIDPPGCGCTDCILGCSRPADPCTCEDCADG